MDFDSDSDEESQLSDIHQLNAVLEADERTCDNLSQFSSTLSIDTSSSKILQEYSKLQEALSFNKLKDEKLRRLEGILVARLHECRQKLKEIEGNTVEPSQIKDKHFRYFQCGKPYFKARDGFPPPENQDAILMAKSQMYDFINLLPVPGWTIKDKSEFLSLLKTMSITSKKTELNSKISQLQRDSKKKKISNVDKQIASIKKEIDGLKHKTLKELALPLDEEYDWEAVALKSGYRHNPQEYCALWKLFLHPSINKSSWSKNEHLKLQEIAHNHKFQDWEEIAKELNTGRTGYQCFVYFRTNMSNTFTGQKWTKEEEEYLLRLIEYYKEDRYIPWSKITSFMENRTKVQIYNKYLRLTEKRKGRFLPEEDAVILTCVNKFGVDYKKMTSYLPGRSAAQLRVRYNILCSGAKGRLISKHWSVEEDKKLIQLMANQDVPTNYSALTKHFPGKDRACIRARYTTLKKWMKKYPTYDIERAPRRGARRLGHGQAGHDLLKAVEQLKKKMESEVKVKKSKKITKDSDDSGIDTAIVAALINESINEEEHSKHKANNGNDKEEEYIPITSAKSVHSNNLNNTLLKLKAQLQKDKFMKTTAGKQYKELTVPKPSPALLVKSYSKKGPVQVLCIEKPDIWGEKVLTTSNYMFPPNYATITGCRKLMSFVAMKPAVKIPWNYSLICRRNPLFKTELDKLMDRVTMLILWPMLLSNVQPGSYSITSKKPYVRRTRPGTGSLFPADINLAMPQNTTNIVNENIDLENSSSEGDSTLNVYVDGNDYLENSNADSDDDYILPN